MSAVPNGTLAMPNDWVTPYHVPVYLAYVPFVPPNVHQYVPPMADLNFIELYWTVVEVLTH